MSYRANRAKKTPTKTIQSVATARTVTKINQLYVDVPNISPDCQLEAEELSLQ